MKDLLIYIAQNLVDNPDDVSVTEKETDSETVLELRVAPGDMGKVIGRQGKVAKEIPGAAAGPSPCARASASALISSTRGPSLPSPFGEGFGIFRRH